MNQSVFALVGLSGVGKSTIIGKLANRFPLQHLQASALIKEEIKSHVEHDQTRALDIQLSQSYLIRGFEKNVDSNASIIFIDAHTIIDTPNGVVEIESAVFEKMKISALIFLADNEHEIFMRRQNDRTRTRPDRPAKELEHQQQLSLICAFRIAHDVDVPMIVVTPRQIDVIASFVSLIRLRNSV